jgi:hypothetical protein
MSKLQDIVLEHGGSFEGAKNKAGFWFPGDELESHRFQKLKFRLQKEGRDVKPCGDTRDSWVWVRYVGERKAYREIRVDDPKAEHGISNKLVIRVWPNGVVEVREAKRRSGYSTNVSSIYKRALMNALFQARAAKGKTRKKKKAERRC